MADQYGEPGTFPDSHTTATTTTVTQTTASSSLACTFDKGYVLSLAGIIRIIQIVVGFFYWVVLASYPYNISGYGWVIFVAVTCWVFTVILFLLFLCMLTKRITIINWVLTELINNAAWCLLHFIAAILISVRAGQLQGYYQTGKLIFGSLCGWALFVLYGVSTFLNFREFMAMGGMNSLRGLGRTPDATATTTTTATTFVTPQSGQEQPGEKSNSPPPYPGGPFT